MGTTMITVVYIVLCNGRIDEVFDDYDAAVCHQQNLIKKWNISKIISKEVKHL